MLFLDYQPELNETDIEIYKVILSDLNQISKISVRELADKSHTSTASVLRFCKKFRCTGFSEFKVYLSAYVDSLTEEKKVKTLDFESELLNFLARTQDKFFEEKIDEAVHLLMEKELIVFVGVGSSNIVAEYGALYFSSLFNMAIRIEDPSNYPINYVSSELAKKMCVVALSVSGETTEIINYLNHLNLSESSVIGVTSSYNSTLSRLVDIAITYNISLEKINEADITTQIPAMYIIEKLAKTVRNKKASTNEYDC
ncbi:MurR/RpiR family transcriptional regulator [Enterococcus sp. RIT-PI-f]|uniref:MurR/RpiR family transcriptional regulator n=1 Tax=Enterococcus sp. RIT-PI-f TaxID=1690244 RepID=UPI0006B91628|nr:MurR/RpiR family transcriptional regulator [Enterococcus sp. RIT-PI-f]KPG71534.1 RpiR family transcriptional regulator [Enterococcus sp. RIT-PI-f]